MFIATSRQRRLTGQPSNRKPVSVIMPFGTESLTVFHATKLTPVRNLLKGLTIITHGSMLLVERVSLNSLQTSSTAGKACNQKLEHNGFLLKMLIFWARHRWLARNAGMVQLVTEGTAGEEIASGKTHLTHSDQNRRLQSADKRARAIVFVMEGHEGPSMAAVLRWSFSSWGNDGTFASGRRWLGSRRRA